MAFDETTSSALYARHYVICPWCDAESDSRIDHLYDDAPRPFGPWYCSKCGKPFEGHVAARGAATVKRCSHAAYFTRSMSLLKLDGTDGAVYFVMDHNRYHSNSKPESDEDFQSGAAFFFEEHSCPANWLSECVGVIKGGDADPHGFLEFVRAIDVPQTFDAGDESQWETLFPEAFPSVRAAP